MQIIERAQRAERYAFTRAAEEGTRKSARMAADLLERLPRYDHVDRPDCAFDLFAELRASRRHITL